MAHKSNPYYDFFPYDLIASIRSGILNVVLTSSNFICRLSGLSLSLLLSTCPVSFCILFSYVCVFLCSFVYVSVSLSIRLFTSLCRSVFVWLCRSVFVCLWRSVFVCLCRSVYSCVSVSVSFCVCLSMLLYVTVCRVFGRGVRDLDERWQIPDVCRPCRRRWRKWRRRRKRIRRRRGRSMWRRRRWLLRLLSHVNKSSERLRLRSVGRCCFLVLLRRLLQSSIQRHQQTQRTTAQTHQYTSSIRIRRRSLDLVIKIYFHLRMTEPGHWTLLYIMDSKLDNHILVDR